MTRLPYTTVALTIFAASAVNAQNLSDTYISLISARLADAAQASWELGTRAQAILSMNATAYSAITPSTSLPPPAALSPSSASELQPVFDIARNIVAGRAASNGNVTVIGPQPLIKDGSAADPASIGVAVLLANWTGQPGEDFAAAAKDQLDFLQFVVPRTSDGALSHRVSEVQLWSDFVYMVPPFLAYYGVVSRNRTLLVFAHDQIKLYRNYLRDTQAGVWKHVLLGSSGIDEGHWSTGNGWAAAGMLRVLGTIQNSEYANTMKNEQKDLATWVKEIHDGMYQHLDPSQNLFTNYATQPVTAPGNFFDAASTALLASTVYRFSLLWGEHSHLPIAERSRKALSAPLNNATTDLTHFTTDGYLTPVVNPHQYGKEGSKSAEGQAFVIEMHAAWRDWVKDGSKGANGALRSGGGVGLWIWVWVCVCIGGGLYI